MANKIGSGYAKSQQLVTSRGTNFRLGKSVLPGLSITNTGPSEVYVVINARVIGGQGSDPAARSVLSMAGNTDIFSGSYEMIDSNDTGMIGFATDINGSTLESFSELAPNTIIDGDTLRLIKCIGASAGYPTGLDVQDYYEFPIEKVISDTKLQLGVEVDAFDYADVNHRLFEIWRGKNSTKMDNAYYWYTPEEVITNGIRLTTDQTINISCHPGNPTIYGFAAVVPEDANSATLACHQSIF